MKRKFKYHLCALNPIVDNIDKDIDKISLACWTMILDMCEFMDMIGYDVSQWKPELIFDDDIAALPHLDVLYEDRANEYKIDENALRNEVKNLRYSILLLIMQCIGKAWKLLNKDWNKIYALFIPDLVKAMIDNMSENPEISFALTDNNGACNFYKVIKVR